MPTTSNTEGKNVCPICHGAGYLRRDVPPGHPDFGIAIPCRCKEEERRQKRLEQLRRSSNLSQVARMTFDSFVPEGYGLTDEQRDNLRRAYETARRYAENPDRWLILKGAFGCGKTHLAAAIANEQLARGREVLFVVVPDLLDHLRATFAPISRVSYDELFDAVRNTPLLILDDLGTQSTTPWAYEKLYQLLNYRYNARLPTVITTNQEFEDIDIRLRSRIVDPDISTIVHIQARDFRAAAETTHFDLSSLGLHADQTFDRFDLRTGLPQEERTNLRRTYEAAKKFAAKPKGWFVLTGVSGCGKTHLAAAIANALQAQGRPVLFVVVPDLLDYLRAAFSPTSHISLDRRFEEIRNAPCLILDDLGTENATPWAKEKMFQLINHRWSARLPTVITTQQSVEDLEPRLRSRLLDPSRCQVWAIIAPSYFGPQDSRATPTNRAKRRGVGVRR